MAQKQLVVLDMNNNTITNLPTPSAGGDAANKDFVTSQNLTRQDKTSVTVGINSAAYPTDGTADDVQLQAAINALHAASGGTVDIISPITISVPITMYADVRLRGGYDATTVSIAATFSGGVAFIDNSGASAGLTIENIKVDLSGKTDVGGIHIYQGNFIRLRDIWITGQGYSSASKWALRVGNYTSGSPAGTASHGSLLKNIRITSCNTGTYEQILFVNQQDARIEKPYFEGNTNSLAYELMLYINNKNVTIDSPHFENCSANSIGMMESDGIIVSDTTGNYNGNFNVFTIINTRNFIIDNAVVRNTVSSPTCSLVNFFDRALGPDGFTQMVDDTERGRISNMHVSGFKSIANVQTIGTISTTDYTGNQSNITFENITGSGLGIPFNIGVSDAANAMHDWDFNNITILDWNGINSGAFQLRGYTTAPTQMYGFRLRKVKVLPTIGAGSSSAVRIIGMQVQSINDSDFTGTFVSYGTISYANSGTLLSHADNLGLDDTGAPINSPTFTGTVTTPTGTTFTSPKIAGSLTSVSGGVDITPVSGRITVNGATANVALNVKSTGTTARMQFQAGAGDNPGIELTNDTTGTRRTLIRLAESGTDGTELQVFTRPDAGGAVVNTLTAKSNGDLVVTGAITSGGTAVPRIAGDISGTTAAPTIKSRSATKTVGPAGSSADYVCDGAADEVEINQAITAVNAAGGGTVQLRAGTYTTAASVVMKTNVRLIGEGIGNTIITGAASDYSLINTPKSGTTKTLYSNIAVELLTLKSNYGTCLSINNTNSVTVRAVEFYFTVTTPIKQTLFVQHCQNVIVTENIAHDYTGNGLSVTSTDYFTVSNNVISGGANGDDGIDVDFDFLDTSAIPSNYGTVTGNTVRTIGRGNGIRIENSNYVSVGNNSVDGVTSTASIAAGIIVNSTGVNVATGITVTGNTITNCIPGGIATSGTNLTNVSIVGNTIFNSGADGGSVRGGILLNSAGVNVVSNLIDTTLKIGADGAAVLVYKKDSHNIANNTIKNSITGLRLWNGDALQSYTALTILDNHFEGNTTTAVTTAATATSRLFNNYGLTDFYVPERVNTVASSATPAINTNTTDLFTITALAVAITSITSGLTGTPTDGQKLMIRITGDATPRTIAWGTSFVSSGVATLLATTAASKTHIVGLVYDLNATKWVCVAVDATGY